MSHSSNKQNEQSPPDNSNTTADKFRSVDDECIRQHWIDKLIMSQTRFRDTGNTIRVQMMSCHMSMSKTKKLILIVDTTRGKQPATYREVFGMDEMWLEMVDNKNMDVLHWHSTDDIKDAVVHLEEKYRKAGMTVVAENDVFSPDSMPSYRSVRCKDGVNTLKRSVDLNEVDTAKRIRLDGVQMENQETVADCVEQALIVRQKMTRGIETKSSRVTLKLAEESSVEASSAVDASITDENDTAENGSSEDNESKAKKKNRCALCRKKIGLTGFECRCGGLYCGIHRYSDKHECKFDYRQLGAQEIRRNNPVVIGEKIQKI